MDLVHTLKSLFFTPSDTAPVVSEYDILYVRSQIKKMNPYITDEEMNGIFELCGKISNQHPNHCIIIRERIDEVGSNGLVRTATLRERQDFRTTCGVVIKVSDALGDQANEYKKSLINEGDIWAFHPDVPIIFSVLEYHPIHLLCVSDLLFKIKI